MQEQNSFDIKAVIASAGGTSNLRLFWRSDTRAGAMLFVDVIVIFIAAQIAWMLRFEYTVLSTDHIFVSLVASLIWWARAANNKLYEITECLHLWQGLRRVATTWIYVVLVVTALAFATKSGQEFSRLWAGGWLLLTTVGLMSARLAWNVAIRRAEMAGHFCTRTAIVGSNAKLVNELTTLLDNHRSSSVVGVFGKFDNATLKVPRSTQVGSVQQLIADCNQLNIDSIWLAADWNDPKEIEHLRHSLSVLPIEIHAPILAISNAFPNREVGIYAGTPAVKLGRQPLSSGEQLLKRSEDITLACLFFLILSPVLLLVALLVKMDSPGPVLFRQRRHGFANGTFDVFKFRTMYFNNTQQNEFKQATKNDARITRLGRVLRRTSVDELPQLLNVILGDMSIVGPRPHPVALSYQSMDNVETYLARHKVKPGITGWAQINGLRGETNTLEKMTKRVEADLWYVDNWSVWLDFRIIIMTLPALLDENAY